MAGIQQIFNAEIRDAAGGPVEVALDVVGGSMFMPLLSALKQRRRYASSGAIAGPSVEFDLRHLVYKDLQMTGATITPPGMFARAVNLIESGALKPVLAKSFPLQKLAEAQKAFMAKSHVGNLVVSME